MLTKAGALKEEEEEDDDVDVDVILLGCLNLASLGQTCLFPPAAGGDGLQWEVQDWGTDPPAGQRALGRPRDALPPGRHRHPGEGHPGGHRGLGAVAARRWGCAAALRPPRWTLHSLTHSLTCFRCLHQRCSLTSTRTSS